MNSNEIPQNYSLYLDSSARSGLITKITNKDILEHKLNNFRLGVQITISKYWWFIVSCICKVKKNII